MFLFINQSVIGQIIIEGENPSSQFGSKMDVPYIGKGQKFPGASEGRVLGSGWGSLYGHFAEYKVHVEKLIVPARVSLRYSRGFASNGYLQIELDGQILDTIAYDNTGGWGENQYQFRTTAIDIEKIEAGGHTLRITVVNVPKLSEGKNIAVSRFAASETLDLIGNRTDKNTVGHGNNVALYTGFPSKFFFATHELGNVFSAADGTTLNWFPDHVLVRPFLEAAPNVNIDKIMITRAVDKIEIPGPALSATENIIDLRQVCVTRNDVVISKISLSNPSKKALWHTIELTGDCRGSFDWREKPGGKKSTRQEGNILILTDQGVFPANISNGLCMAIGGNIEPVEVDTGTPGTYRMVYKIFVPGNSTKSVTLAIAINADEKKAIGYLKEALKQDDPIAENRQDWQKFYDEEIPKFSSSNRGLTELYGLRWFLLKFSTAGGNLGFFKYPVVMEGREAYQTYCCYSAPFMAYDMNWCVDPQKGFGHIANMCEIAYEDGRFPFYTSPRTNNVQLHHESHTGQSALEDAMWKHYLIHGDKRMLQQVYPAMKKNMEWWIKDRDYDGNGLFIIKDQLECMDDVYRWGYDNRKEPYESLTANSTTYVNLRSTAKIARELGYDEDADYFDAYADKTAKAVNTILWDKERKSYFDRRSSTGELATHYPIISMFYPYYAGIGNAENMDVFRKHLLNPEEFWLPHPVPALPKNHPDFAPEKYWQGPAWPASTSHVVEGFSNAAKKYDRSLLPEAAELFKKAISLHLQPRADFYERYNPLNGQGLSVFRDYMHSWWIDLIVRDAVGFMIEDDRTITIDPLPLGLEDFALRGIPFNEKKIDIFWNNPAKQVARDVKKGLVVFYDGKEILHDAEFLPGGEPKHIKVGENQ